MQEVKDEEKKDEEEEEEEQENEDDKGENDKVVLKNSMLGIPYMHMVNFVMTNWSFL